MALETARRENAGSDRNVGELQDLLKQIALKDKVEDAKEFADRIQTSLLAITPSRRAPYETGADAPSWC